MLYAPALRQCPGNGAACLTRFPAGVKSLVTLGLLPRLARMLPHSQDKRRISHAFGADAKPRMLDPLEMWPATERATQSRFAQHAGVGDVGTLAKAWGRGVHARLRGSLRRTGGRTRLQDTQPADRQLTSGCPSLLSLLLVPNLCMLTCLRVRARVRLCTCVYVSMRA